MKIEFVNPIFHEGINTTCRRGDKYGDLRPRGTLALCRSGSSVPVTTATVHSVLYIRFMDIRDQDIQHEHDPHCRYVNGLFAEMQKCYPGFQQDELVTLINFMPDTVQP